MSDFESVRRDKLLAVPRLAERVGVTPRVLRYWEEQGLISPTRDHGKLRYSPRDVAIARLIRQLLEAGVGVEGIRMLRRMAESDIRRSSAARDEEALVEVALRILYQRKAFREETGMDEELYPEGKPPPPHDGPPHGPRHPGGPRAEDHPVEGKPPPPHDGPPHGPRHPGGPRAEDHPVEGKPPPPHDGPPHGPRHPGGPRAEDHPWRGSRRRRMMARRTGPGIPVAPGLRITLWRGSRRRRMMARRTGPGIPVAPAFNVSERVVAARWPQWPGGTGLRKAVALIGAYQG